jgi:hypothetical protein
VLGVFLKELRILSGLTKGKETECKLKSIE